MIPETELARLRRVWGARRLRDALRRAVESRGGDPLRLARALAGAGRHELSARALLAALAPGAAAPASSAAGAVQDLLARRGWALGLLPARGAIRLGLRLAGSRRRLAELSIEARGEAGGTILPSVRVRAAAGAGLGTLERAALEELSNLLGLLFESLRARAAPGTAPQLSETHQGGLGGVERILRITFACNHRCPFCFVPASGRVDGGAIEAAIDALARELAPDGTLTVSGGEPAVDPRLTRIIEYARGRGIRRFVLQTNGSALARPGLIDRLLALGVKGFDVSFHSHRPAVFDRITGSRGQFPRLLESVSRLLQADCAVTACVLINAWSYRELPALMGFLGRLARRCGRDRARPMEVCFAVINGAGMNGAPQMAVDLGKAAPFLQRALERCEREGLGAQRFTGESSLPPCLVREPQKYAGELEMSQDRVRYAEDFSGDAGCTGRAKRPDCRRCPYDRLCLGVPAEYARLFGLSALGLRRPGGEP